LKTKGFSPAKDRRKITIDEYNTYRQEIIEKLKSAIAAPPKT
jgi:hypothetical protein